MSAPAVVITLQLEARPRVHVVALHDGDEERLADWLDVKSEYAELVRRALELERQERAA